MFKGFWWRNRQTTCKKLFGNMGWVGSVTFFSLFFSLIFSFVFVLFCVCVSLNRFLLFCFVFVLSFVFLEFFILCNLYLRAQFFVIFCVYILLLYFEFIVMKIVCLFKKKSSEKINNKYLFWTWFKSETKAPKCRT